MMSGDDGVPVTVIEPGKRGLRRATRAPATFAAVDDSPERPVFVTENDPYAMDAIAAAQRAEAQSVALQQPHRREFAYPGSPWLASPLGRFCKRAWPGDHDLREACYRSGSDYARDVRAARVARGFFVDGVGTEARGVVPNDEPTLDGVRSAKAAIEAADAKVAEANAVLRGVMPRAPRAVEALCCGSDEPSPYDEGILKAGLWRLATHYGIIGEKLRGINSLKDF